MMRLLSAMDLVLIIVVVGTVSATAAIVTWPPVLLTLALAWTAGWAAGALHRAGRRPPWWRRWARPETDLGAATFVGGATAALGLIALLAEALL